MTEGSSESPARTASPAAPRTRRRSRPAAAIVAALAPRTRASCQGSWASGSARLASGITAMASPRRRTPRAPGTRRTGPRTRGLRPEATPIVPSLRRAATAQCVGPCTSSPLRRAIPPRRSFSSLTPDSLRGATPGVAGGRSAEQLERDRPIGARGPADVARGDALVLAVHERPHLEQVLVALREEAVGHAPVKGVAERARVGVGGQ